MPDADRPNVLVVLCDQMRGQAMGCAGDPNVETPALDRLAAEGVRFENANSTCPICVPARFSALTGQHAHTRDAHNGWRMSPAERLVAGEFGDAGYRTGMVGKWHLANWGNDSPPPAIHRGGFDHWRGFEVVNQPFETVYYTDEDDEPHQMDEYQTDGLVDLGIDFLDAGEEPFFGVVSVEPPHPPFIAPDESLERWTDRELTFRPNVPFGEGTPPEKHVPPGGVEPYESWGDRHEATEELFERRNYHGDTFSDEMRAYYAMVENLDHNVGRLLDALEERGIREDTVVAFVSDHGEMLGSHGLMMKQHPYEESVNVPFILSYPGGDLDAGRTVSAPTCLEDWYPTLCGLAGLSPEGDLPGVDLSGLARGDGDLDREGVLLEFVYEGRPEMPYADETWRGFRTERYKYTVNGGEPWQLFDLEADPYEQENLLGNREDLATRMHGLLRDALVEYDDGYSLAPAFGHDGHYHRA
jgi:arylsulfatase A-like enzyme